MGRDANQKPKAKAKAKASAEEAKAKAKENRAKHVEHENAMQRLRTAATKQGTNVKWWCHDPGPVRPSRGLGLGEARAQGHLPQASGRLTCEAARVLSARGPRVS